MSVSRTPHPRPAGAHLRRRRYVDKHLQGRLALMLVLFEVLVIVLACVYLYHAFAGVLDERLYAVHPMAGDDLLRRLASELGWALLGCVVANGVLVSVLYRAWSRHTGGVFSAFGDRLDRLGALDLRDPRAVGGRQGNHRVLALFDKWLKLERQRVDGARRCLERLPIENASALTRMGCADVLAALDRVGNYLKRSGAG